MIHSELHTLTLTLTLTFSPSMFGGHQLIAPNLSCPRPLVVQVFHFHISPAFNLFNLNSLYFVFGSPATSPVICIMVSVTKWLDAIADVLFVCLSMTLTQDIPSDKFIYGLDGYHDTMINMTMSCPFLIS